MNRLTRTISNWLDAPDDSVTGWARPARFALRLIYRAALQLHRDRATLMAAAITYRTVFALVPVLIVSLVVLRFFLGTDAISEGLNTLLEQFGLTDLTLGEAANAGEPATVAQWLESIVVKTETINFGAIGAVGALLLIYAAISMLSQIEQCFNVIYAAPSGRKLAARLTTYWTMLTLGPIGIIASLTLGSRLGAVAQPLGGAGARVIDSALSLGISWLILLVAYALIPNTRVKIRPAAIGALLAAVLWELGKQGFRSYLGFSTGYAALYGSLGLIPVFFLWMFVTWLIVLLGLEVSRALQVITDPLHAGRLIETPPDPACALAMLTRAAAGFEIGAPMTLADASTSAGVTPRAAESILTQLIDAGFLHPVETDEDEPRFALAREPGALTATAILERLAPDNQPDTAGTIRKTITSRYDGLTVADLAAKASPPSAP